MVIRWMMRRDIPEVLEVENETSANPLTREGLLCHLRRRNCIGMVEEVDDEIRGFMLYELHRTSLAILKLSVHPNHQRTGVAKSMIRRLKDKLTQQRRRAIDIEIHEENMEAQRFLKEMGFRAYHVQRDYYDDGRSAYYFRYALPMEAPEMERIAA